MVYPSHYNPGEFNLSDPNAAPGTTVTRSLLDFQAALEGRKSRLTPWLQDFSLGRTYTLADVRALDLQANRPNEFQHLDHDGVRELRRSRSGPRC